MEIRLGGFKMRPWRVGDECSLQENADNPRFNENLRDRFPSPYTLEDARQWIEATGKQKPPSNFAIEVSGKAVGAIGLDLQDDVHRRSAEIGYWLGEPYWGRGIMTAAVRAMTDYGFATFDICRIFATVYEWNPASARVLEKAGFEFEARLRKSVTKNARTGALLIFAQVR